MNMEVRMVTLRVVMVLAMLSIVVDQVRENHEQGFYVLSQTPISIRQYVDAPMPTGSIPGREAGVETSALGTPASSYLFQALLAQERIAASRFPMPTPQQIAVGSSQGIPLVYLHRGSHRTDL
jgi:hypothetical protein